MLKGNCVECPVGTYPKDGKCEGCLPDCGACKDGKSCETCKKPKALHKGLCVDVCPPLFYPALGNKTDICKECGIGCGECAGPQVCDVCKPGHYKKNGKCHECNPECGTCEKAGKCKSCKDEKLALYNGKCVDSCPIKHYANKDKECVDCSPGCEKCVNAEKCEECKEGKVVFKEACIDGCPIKYYEEDG